MDYLRPSGRETVGAPSRGPGLSANGWCPCTTRSSELVMEHAPMRRRSGSRRTGARAVRQAARLLRPVGARAPSCAATYDRFVMHEPTHHGPGDASPANQPMKHAGLRFQPTQRRSRSPRSKSSPRATKPAKRPADPTPYTYVCETTAVSDAGIDGRAYRRESVRVPRRPLTAPHSEHGTAVTA